MKRLKILLLAVMAICVGLCFSGCAKDAKLEEGSFYYELKIDNYGCRATYNFYITAPEDENYTVYYYLTGKTEDGETVMTETVTGYYVANSSAISGNSRRFSGTLSFGAIVEEDSVRLEVKTVRKKKHIDQVYVALGFGILGILVLGACTTLFVLDKKGIIGKKK